MSDKNAYVYILASQRNGTLYTGVTSNIIHRAIQHRSKELEGFTKRYDITQLVYYEICETIESAIRREKQIKEWKRQWKLRLIESKNPDWKDLYAEIVK